MPITLNGSGTVSGISAGGLPDGIIQSADLASGVCGNTLQVVSTHKSDTFTHSTTTFTDITGMSATITPSSSSSKILIIVDIKMAGQVNATSAQCLLLRGSTVINLGDAAGSRTRSMGQSYYDAQTYHMAQTGGIFLDSPNTTSATTYKLQTKSESSGSVVYVNRTQGDRDGSEDSRGTSNIVLMEVAA